MKQNVEHKDIPFDELGTFKSINDDQFQHILIQTLLLTTLATFHSLAKKNHKSATFITTKSIWISDKKCVAKPKMLLPIKAIEGVVKSYRNPELTIMTTHDSDNIRVTTTTEERCWCIISAISYIFTEVHKKKLPFITINSGLHYFQRTTHDKMNGSNINLNSNTFASQTQMITYQKPFTKIPNVFGFIKQSCKIVLEKQLQSQQSYSNANHQVYLARAKEESFEADVKLNQKLKKNKNGAKQEENISQKNDEENKYNQIIVQQLEDEDRYICHYIQNDKQYLQQLYQHENLQFITEMVYAKNLQYKIQIFFQYTKSLRGTKINQIIFQQIWSLYDKVKSIDVNAVISTDSLLVIQKSQIIGKKIKRSQPQTDLQQLQRWKKGEYAILIKQFRYKFLNEAIQWDRFLYEDTPSVHEARTKKEIDSQKKLELSLFHSKIYNIGLILYELATGRHLLLYSPVFGNSEQIIDQQISMIYQLKKEISDGKYHCEIFPKFMNLNIREKLKKFIECCIFKKFDNQDELVSHPWLANKNRKVSDCFSISQNGYQNGQLI